MPRRPVTLALSAAGCVGFVVVALWTVAFLTDTVLPHTIDGPVRTDTATAVAVDVALLLLFAVQHSLMARQRAKRWMARAVPRELERTAYVLATDVCLALLLALWQPFGGTVWSVGGPAAALVWALSAAGGVLALVAASAVDPLDLMGLRQAGWATVPDAAAPPALRTDGLYGVVRHPLMTGLLLAIWATPAMGASHLVFALAVTGYVLVGITFEERDLRRTFGADYDAYAARVPALVPWAPLRHNVIG